MILHVEAKPNAHKNDYEIINENTLRIRIKAPPVEGKANEAIIAYLSEILHIPKSKIVLLKGAAAKYKQFEVAIENLKRLEAQ
jgi:uncharacterized protein (TIGR00251 family)